MHSALPTTVPSMSQLRPAPQRGRLCTRVLRTARHFNMAAAAGRALRVVSRYSAAARELPPPPPHRWLQEPSEGALPVTHRERLCKGALPVTHGERLCCSTRFTSLRSCSDRTIQLSFASESSLVSFHWHKQKAPLGRRIPVGD